MLADLALGLVPPHLLVERVEELLAGGCSGEGCAVEEGATEAAEVEEALGGGEDYELVVVMAPGDLPGYQRRCAAAGLRPPVPIGTVGADVGARRLGDEPLARLGWQHAVG